MEYIIKNIIDKFTHIVRDILFYCVTGFVVLIFIYIEYRMFYVNNVKDISFPFLSNTLVIIVLSYVIGNINNTMSFCLKKTCSKKVIINLCKKNKNRNVVLLKEIKAFKGCEKINTKAFEYYIDRYNNLFNFRRILSFSFFNISILSIISLIFLSLFENKDFRMCDIIILHILTLVFNLILFLSIYCHSISTEYQFLKRIDAINIVYKDE